MFICALVHNIYYIEEQIRYDYCVIWLKCNECGIRYRYDYWMEEDLNNS